jgi:hypothetical protein
MASKKRTKVEEEAEEEAEEEVSDPVEEGEEDEDEVEEDEGEEEPKPKKQKISCPRTRPKKLKAKAKGARRARRAWEPKEEQALLGALCTLGWKAPPAVLKKQTGIERDLTTIKRKVGRISSATKEAGLQLPILGMPAAETTTSTELVVPPQSAPPIPTEHVVLTRSTDFPEGPNAFFRPFFIAGKDHVWLFFKFTKEFGSEIKSWLVTPHSIKIFISTQPPTEADLQYCVNRYNVPPVSLAPMNSTITYDFPPDVCILSGRAPIIVPLTTSTLVCLERVNLEETKVNHPIEVAIADTSNPIGKVIHIEEHNE